MENNNQRLGIFKLAIEMSWKRNLLYLIIASVPCYLTYIFLGEHISFLREGILWIPFFVIYLYLRYKNNQKDFPESLFIKISDDKISIPAIRYISDIKVDLKYDEIDKILFFYTVSRRGKPLLSYCEIFPKNGKKIRLSTFQIDLYSLKDLLSKKDISVFSKKDDRLKNTRYLMAFIVMIFLVMFIFFIISADAKEHLFDYIFSLKILKDYFGF